MTSNRDASLRVFCLHEAKKSIVRQDDHKRSHEREKCIFVRAKTLFSIVADTVAKITVSP